MRVDLIMWILVVIVTATLTVAESCPDDEPVVVCYYASWAVYRLDGGTFKIEYIKPELCTHLIYSFAGLTLDGVMDSLDPQNDIKNGGYAAINELKEEHPCLKTMMAIGGWNEGSERYSLMAERQDTRQKFADAALRFLCHYGFDGLDIDWEYPTQRRGIADDRENFIELLRTLKETFAKRNKLVTVAIGAASHLIRAAYDVERMCAVADLVLVMAYDFQDRDALSVHAPLKRESDDDDSRSVIDDGIAELLASCDPQKLVLGIGAFGRSFTMKSKDLHARGSEVADLGKAGPYLLAAGSLGYNEICEMMANDPWTVVELAKNAISYAYKDKQWVSYDDPRSIAIKATYVRDMGMRGMMLYSIDTDDFNGDCFGQSYPLLNAINKGLNRT